MWREIHLNKVYNKMALYVGIEGGYKVVKIYSSVLTAKIAAKIFGYKFCKTT